MSATQATIEELAGIDGDGIELPIRRDKPFLKLPGDGQSFTNCAETLFKKLGESKTLFRQGKTLARIVRGAIEPIPPAGLRTIAEKHFELIAERAGRGGKSVWAPALLSQDAANAMLASEEFAEHMPPIVGVLRCGFLREANGGLHIVGPGYDSATGYYVLGNEKPPEIPLERAVADLRGLLSDFDFASPSDESRAIAAMITPAMRFGGLLKGHVPIEIAEADKSQSGKTFRLVVNAALYGETDEQGQKRLGGVGSLDEQIGSCFASGKPFVLLDNYRGRLNSPMLEAFATAETFNVRLPHRGYAPVDPTRIFLRISSNGMSSTEDFLNRATVVRVRKRPPSHEWRQFPEGELLDHVRANQLHYLGCIFSIVREWHLRGCPATQENRHSFRDWARKLDWIVQNLFGLAPLVDGLAEVQNRTASVDRSWLRAYLLAADQGGRLGASMSASCIFEFCQSRPPETDVLPPGTRADDETLRGARQVGIVMARLFGDSDRLEAEGFCLNRSRLFYNGDSDRPEYVAHRL